jgi:hypothetical protein
VDIWGVTRVLETKVQAIKECREGLVEMEFLIGMIVTDLSDCGAKESLAA